MWQTTKDWRDEMFEPPHHFPYWNIAEDMFLPPYIYVLIYSLYSLYIYIYITEDFETPTIFHISIILKKKIKT